MCSSDLTCSAAPQPSPGPGQILVRVDAASLNYRDLLVARNTYRWSAPLPFVPASDMAGTVLAVGEGVQRWRGGERVISTFVAGWLDGAAPAASHSLGVPGPGMLATHVLLDAEWAAPAPATAPRGMVWSGRASGCAGVAASGGCTVMRRARTSATGAWQARARPGANASSAGSMLSQPCRA